MFDALRLIIAAMWLAWVVYWSAASRGAKPVERREPLTSRLLHVVPLLLVVALLWLDRVPGSVLNERLYPPALWEPWMATLLTGMGLLFTVWARVHLGRNWSGTVTIKQDHELIVGGPYAIVRHPIYTGLLVAFVGTAMVRAEWRGAVAVLIALLAFWRKLRIEERWMIGRFGERYFAYCQRVPALVPFSKAAGREVVTPKP